MARRSYHQYCGLAAALDVVGERWTLLIVRDLTPGPRRFTDLLAGLPGLATDLLSDRLRCLQDAGVVEVASVAYPSPARLYRLTERGAELGRIAGGLAQWGTRLLPPVGDGGHRLDPRWALQSLALQYRGGLPTGQYGWTIDGDDFTVTVADDDTAAVHYGAAADPLVHVTASSEQFFRLARAAGRGKADVRGRRDLVAQFFTSMRLPMAET